MPVIFIPFDGWSPGGREFGEGWRVLEDVFPFFQSWRPWRKFTVTPGPGTAFGPMTGAHRHSWTSGIGTSSYSPDASTLFCGSSTRLFTVDPSSGGFTDVSRAANYGAGVGTTPAGWRFASVGNDIFATNWFDPVQRRTNNAGLFADGFTSTFTPIPRFLAVIREHLVCANLSNVGRFQDEIAWSDADNAINFDPPTGTSTSIAGAKRLVSIPGQITALVGGQYGLAFKREAVFLLESTGSVRVLRPEVLSAHVGTGYPGSVIQTRHGVFFLGPDGFYQIVGLQEPQMIGDLGVAEFLLNTNFSTQSGFITDPAREDTQVRAFQVPGLPLIGWAYRENWSDQTNDRVLLYNPVTQKWGHGTFPDPGISVLVSRSSGNTIFDALGGFTFSSGTSRYASASLAVQPAVLGLRFRPANFEEASQFQQTHLLAVMPVFSRGSAAASPTPDVMVQVYLDPNQTTANSESMGVANRDMAGWYPFQIAGRLINITIRFGADEDFADFSGVFVRQELLK